MSVRANVHGLCTDLAGVASLLAQQVKAGLDEAETKDSLFGAWKVQLGNLFQLSQTDVKCLTEAVNDGPWSDEQKKQFAKLIAAAYVREEAVR